jgi:hypothetical protein
MIKLSAVLALLVLSLSSLIFGQNPTKEEKNREKDFIKEVGQKDYSDESVAGMLNESFRLHVDGCGLLNTSRDEIKGLPFVPRELRDQVGQVMKNKGEKLEIKGSSALWYVFNDKDIAQKLTTDDPDRLLKMRLDAPSETLTMPDYQSWIMSRNCAGYLSGSVTANGQFPIGSANIALKADSQQKSSIALIGGRFLSPIIAVISEGGWRNFLFNLQLWNLYNSDNTLINHAVYMKEFQGVMVQRKAGINRNFDSKASVSLSIFVLNTQLSAGLTGNSVFDINDYLAVMVSDLENQVARQKRFKPLPSPAEIKQLFSKRPFAKDDKSPEFQFLTEGDELSFSETLQGVSNDVCQNGWSIAEKTTGSHLFADGKLAVTAAPGTNTINGTDLPVCTFQFTATPNADLFRGDDSIGKLKYFTGELSSDLVLPGDLRLTKDVERSFVPSNHPIVRTNFVQPVPFTLTPKDANSFTIGWSKDILVDFIDDQRPVNRNNGAVLNLAAKNITCGANTIPITGTATMLNKQYVISLSSTFSFPSSSYDSSGATFDECTYETPLDVPLKNGKVVTRTLSIQLKVPKAKQ